MNEASPIIKYESDEYISPSQISLGRFCKVRVDTTLPYRKLYLYQEVVINPGTTTDYLLAANVVGRDIGGSPVATLPASMGQDGANIYIGKTVANAFTTLSTSLVQANLIAPHQMKVVLGRQFSAGPAWAILAPTPVWSEAESFDFEITGFNGPIVSGVTYGASGFRVHLAVLSSNRPF